MPSFTNPLITVAHPILPIIKPVNINPGRAESGAVELSSSHTVIPEGLMHKLAREAKNQHISSITIDEKAFLSRFSKEEYAFLKYECEKNHVHVFVKNLVKDTTPRLLPPVPAKVAAPRPLPPVPVKDSVDTVLEKVKEDITKKNLMMVDLFNYGIKASDIPRNKLDELTTFCNKKNVILMY